MRYPEIINETMSDQILAEAFTQQLKGNEDFSRNCVIQALTLQYCGQLGSNGLNVFFSRYAPFKKSMYDWMVNDGQ